MKTVLRILLYAMLIGVSTYCVQRFLAAYGERMERAAQRYDKWDLDEPAEVPPAGINGEAVEPGNGSGTTGRAGAEEPVVADRDKPAGDKPGAASPSPRGRSSLGLYGAVGLLAVLGLALLAGYDIARFAGQRAQRFLGEDDPYKETDREYEEAERLWANGDHLGAVHGLREYLKRHPRRVHASFRIAEIYEKDLHNPLAAALEHEEILTRRLTPERWGWAAIHLCNLYYRLDQPAKAEALLQRIVTEYGTTQAARKARKRLGLPEDVPAEGTEPVEVPVEEPADDGRFRLPPGFRPRK